MEKCPKCDAELKYDKRKDVIEFEGWYFTVVLVACPECGYIDDKQTYLE